MKNLKLFLIFLLIAIIQAQECQTGQVYYNEGCVWCVESNCNGENCDQKCACPEASTCLKNNPCACSECDNLKCAGVPAETLTTTFELITEFIRALFDMVMGIIKILSPLISFVSETILSILNPISRALFGQNFVIEPDFMLHFFFWLMIGLVTYDILYTTSPLSQWVCYILGVGISVISIQLKLIDGMISLVTRFGALFIVILGVLLILSSFTFTGIGSYLKRRREEIEFKRKEIERGARLAKIEAFAEAIGR